MKTLASIIESTINEDAGKLLDLLKPLMTDWAVKGGIDDQVTKRDYSARLFIKDLPNKIEKFGLKKSTYGDAELIISKRYLDDYMVQVFLYKNYPITYYAHGEKNSRSVIYGVNNDDPDRTGVIAAYDIDTEVAQKILQANGVTC